MLVVALCWITIVFDGYDLNVYGAVHAAVGRRTDVEERLTETTGSTRQS